MGDSQKTKMKAKKVWTTAYPHLRPENEADRAREREKVITYLERGIQPKTIAKVTSYSEEEIQRIERSLH